MCGSCQFVYISSEYEIWKELKSTNNHKRKRALHHFFHRCSSGHTILAANIKIHTFKKLLCKCKVEQKTNTRSLTHSHSHNGNAREKKVSRPRTHVPLVIYQRSPHQFYILYISIAMNAKPFGKATEKFCQNCSSNGNFYLYNRMMVSSSLLTTYQCHGPNERIAEIC